MQFLILWIGADWRQQDWGTCSENLHFNKFQVMLMLLVWPPVVALGQRTGTDPGPAPPGAPRAAEAGQALQMQLECMTGHTSPAASLHQLLTAQLFQLRPRQGGY